MRDELSARLKRGEHSALEEIIDKYSPYAAKIIAVYLNRNLPPEDLEEVLADVFLKLWKSRQRIEGEVKPYLAAIARNEARQRLRTYRRTEPLPEDEDLSDESPLPHQLLENEEDAKLLRSAIDAMSPENRELFIRFYYLEQTVEEIAAVTGQNASTLRGRLRRERMKLKNILTERGLRYE